MFEKEAEEYLKAQCQKRKEEFVIKMPEVYIADIPQAFKDGAEFGYNKANEWHYVKDGDLPKENQECYFIYSNTYDFNNKVSFAKSNIQVRTGIYSFFEDDEGNLTTEPCFYDDVIGDEIDLSEVYAWKEIELPKEIQEK